LSAHLTLGTPQEWLRQSWTRHNQLPLKRAELYHEPTRDKRRTNDLRAVLSIQNEHVQSPCASGQQVLFAIQEKRLRRAREAADLRIPEPFTARRIPCLDVRAVAEDQQSPGCRKQSGTAAVNLLPPCDLPGLVVDCDDLRAPGKIGSVARTAEP